MVSLVLLCYRAMERGIAGLMVLCFAAVGAAGEGVEGAGDAYAAWQNGPSGDPGHFPIAVWLQDPRNAPKFREAGINLYLGLWKGPTERQLDALRAAGMRVICAQNRVALDRRSDPTIAGWMHGDEPDNAQKVRDRATGKESYGPPVAPRKIVEDYQTYLFAVGMRNAPASARFEVNGLPAKADAEVLGEARRIAVDAGRFEDRFGPHAVHLYRIR